MELFAAGAATEQPATVVHPRKRAAVDPVTGVDGNGLILVSQCLLSVCLSACLGALSVAQYTVLKYLEGHSLDPVARRHNRQCL